jgi:uncharacterized protein YkwD
MILHTFEQRQNMNGQPSFGAVLLLTALALSSGWSNPLHGQPEIYDRSKDKATVASETENTQADHNSDNNSQAEHNQEASDRSHIPGTTAGSAYALNQRPLVPIDQLEARMFELVNKDRSLFGKQPVGLSKKLSDLARRYAQRLVNDGFYGHVDPEGRTAQVRMLEFGIQYLKMGENISRFGRNGKRDDSQLVDHCQEAMMAEPPDQKNHRGNILNAGFGYVGIGVARTDGKLSIVQEFCDVDPDGPAPDESPR